MFAESAEGTRISRGYRKVAMTAPESREDRAERVALNNHAYLAQRRVDLRPRLIVPAHRSMPLADFLSKVAACHWTSTNGQAAVCN